MAADFPGAIPSLPTNRDDDDEQGIAEGGEHAQNHNRANEEIMALAAELGTNPAGSEVTVKARLDQIEADLTGASGALILDLGSVSTNQTLDFEDNPNRVVVWLSPLAANVNLKLTNVAKGVDITIHVYDAGGGHALTITDESDNDPAALDSTAPYGAGGHLVTSGFAAASTYLIAGLGNDHTDGLLLLKLIDGVFS